jgi:O-antigen ligase
MNKALSDKKIMEYGIYLFIVVLFWGYTTYFKFLGLYIPAVFFFLKITLTKRVYRFWRCPLFIAVILFSISGVLSTAWAVNTLESLVFFEKSILRLLLIYVIIVSVFDNNIRFSKLLYIIALTSLIYVAISYGRYLHELLSLGYIRRLANTELSNAAWPLVYLLPFAMLRAVSVKEKYPKIFWIMATCFSVIALILSGQRGSVAGLIASTCVWFVYARNTTRLTIIMGIIICVGSIFMFASDFPVIKEYSRSVLASGRFYLFEIYVNVVKDNYLLGVGLDNKAMFDAARSNEMVILKQGPHNSFLTIAVKQGLIGAISYILLLSTCIFSIMRRIKRLPFTRYKATGIALLSCFIGMYIINGLASEIVMMPLAILISITSVYLRMKVEDFECVTTNSSRL